MLTKAIVKSRFPIYSHFSILAKGSFWFLLILTFMALIIPFISSYSYSEIHLELKNMAPCAKFWFGSDELGRDIFTRIFYGARLSLFIGIFAATIDAIIGVLWGTVAAYVGGKVDEWMMRFCDILYSVPYLLVVILLTVVRGSGILTLLLAICCTGWINMARLCRSQVHQVKQMPFITAAKSFGASHFRMIFIHLIPNAIGPIFGVMTITIATAIFTEGFLSFIGLGIQAPLASWGAMINDALSAMRYYPWRLLFPALMISLTMLSFNILGNELRDLLDPRLRKN